jgi:hypothetical protein
MSDHGREMVANLGAYVVIAFGSSFWGDEVFLVDLYGLWKYIQDLRKRSM